MPSRRNGGGRSSPAGTDRHRRRASRGRRDGSRSRGDEDRRRHRKEKRRRSSDRRSRNRDSGRGASRRRASESEAASDHRKRRKSGEKRRRKSEKRGKEAKDAEDSDEASVDEFGRSTKRRQTSGKERDTEAARERSRSAGDVAAAAPPAASPCSPAGSGSAEGSKSGDGKAWEEWRAPPQDATTGNRTGAAGGNGAGLAAIDELIKQNFKDISDGAAASAVADGGPVTSVLPPLKPLQELKSLRPFLRNVAQTSSSTPISARPLIPMLAGGSQKKMAQLQWEDEDVLLKQLCEIDKHVTEAKTWEERGEGLLRVLRHRKTGRARVIMQRHGELTIVLNARLELAKFKVQGKRYVCFLALEKGTEKVAYFRAKFRFTPQQESFAAVLQSLHDAHQAKSKTASDAS